MKHIVQVKVDHGVLGIRIPAQIVADHKIKKGHYYVCQSDAQGRLRYRRLKEELEQGHDIKKRKSG